MSEGGGRGERVRYPTDDMILLSFDALALHALSRPDPAKRRAVSDELSSRLTRALELVDGGELSTRSSVAAIHAGDKKQTKKTMGKMHPPRGVSVVSPRA